MIQVRYTRNLFLRGIGIIYLFAFLSFYIQIPGLYGDNGVLPVRNQIDLNAKSTLYQKLRQKPTLVWLAPYLGLNAEYMLDVLSLAGIAISFMSFISQRFCIAPTFAALWALYYSLYEVGHTFMWFQWDILLLEVGFLCMIVAPVWHSNRGHASTPSDGVTFWTVRWLLFRLLVSSGAVKLISGCPVWWNLEGLSYYFQSQCLPSPLAWYAHHLPTWFLRLNTVGANVFELAIPFLFFFPNRKVRIVAFYAEIFLQVHIIATGNFNYFNFLVVCLCISLLDDQFFYKKKPKNDGSSSGSAARIQEYLSTAVCILVYAGLIQGIRVLYNLKLSDNWTIESSLGFTQEQFENVLFKAIPIAMYVGMASLGFTLADAVTNSIMNPKGAQSKVLRIAVTCFYSLVVCFIFALSIVPFSTIHPSQNVTLPAQLRKLHSNIDHLHITNSYGLFRRMTGVGGRPEIIIEGGDSIDGPWKEYEFLYKPGNVNNSLPFVAPHQPRLDWQMWFAALGTYHQNPWLVSLAYRLLTGQPEVLALMSNVESPFRDRPPKYVKASLYHYHFTPWGQRTNSWWTRQKVGEYFPIFSRDHPPLIEYLNKMKILQDSNIVPVTCEPLKLVLDSLRSVFGTFEPSILLWGVFTAGCALIMTGYSTGGTTKRK